MQIHAYEFSDSSFVAGSDAIVCIIRLSELKPYITLREIDQAFSGYASYRQMPWLTRYVGVWGRKNCQRLRRFARERGANVVVHQERPPSLRLSGYVTRWVRKKVRILTR